MTASHESDDEKHSSGGRCPTRSPIRIMKLRDLDRSTYGVTIPVSDLRKDGLVDEDGLTDEWQMVVRHTDRGRWVLEAARLSESRGD